MSIILHFLHIVLYYSNVSPSCSYLFSLFLPHTNFPNSLQNFFLFSNPQFSRISSLFISFHFHPPLFHSQKREHSYVKESDAHFHTDTNTNTNTIPIRFIFLTIQTNMRWAEHSNLQISIQCAVILSSVISIISPLEQNQLVNASRVPQRNREAL